jgi:membrane associated rhomboid family serine protease
MDLKAFFEIFKDRGKNGALFPVVLMIVLAVGAFPTLVGIVLGAVLGVACVCHLGRILGGRALAWWRDRNAPPPERPLVIYLQKRRN